jgi:endonuclease/exonuclease/phosphatase family metal-dependent hydrolase
MSGKSIVRKIYNKIIGWSSTVISAVLVISYFSPYVSPESVWWIQLFGLAYPIILLLFLLLTLIVFFTKKRSFWFMLAIFAVGLPIHTRYLSFGSETDDKERTNEIKITSFNVRAFDVYGWIYEDKLASEEAFISFIEQDSSDILCMQEFVSKHEAGSHLSISKIKKAGKFDYFEEQIIIKNRNKTGFGLSIFSKHPIINRGVVGNEKDLYSHFVDLTINNDTVRVYNTHLKSIRFQQDEYSLFDENSSSNKDYGKRVEGLLKKIKNAYPTRLCEATNVIESAKRSPFTTLICGDFNEPPTSYTYSMFNDQFQDAFRESNSGIGRSYAGKIPAGRIDYIFYNQCISPYQFDIYTKEVMSDHYPISLSFKLE